MATPKKKNKIRDYDRTRKRLLEVVGEILKDTGFTGLKTNNIAKHLGKDKRLIRYYFQSLYNLEKEYILEKDHWITFFKNMELPENINAERVRALFITFIQEHFVFFTQSIEMQKIMLWQLSENNPLIKSIAESREQESERLLKAAEPFIQSGPKFRAILALMTGGLYFLTLQAEAGNATAWGVDINVEKDQAVLLEAIEQIIYWAWQGIGDPDNISGG
jgi:AcrR family transcriptional regulator